MVHFGTISMCYTHYFSRFSGSRGHHTPQLWYHTYRPLREWIRVYMVPNLQVLHGSRCVYHTRYVLPEHRQFPDRRCHISGSHHSLCNCRKQTHNKVYALSFFSEHCLHYRAIITIYGESRWNYHKLLNVLKRDSLSPHLNLSWIWRGWLLWKL